MLELSALLPPVSTTATNIVLRTATKIPIAFWHLEWLSQDGLGVFGQDNLWRNSRGLRKDTVLISWRTTYSSLNQWRNLVVPYVSSGPVLLSSSDSPAPSIDILGGFGTIFSNWCSSWDASPILVVSVAPVAPLGRPPSGPLVLTSEDWGTTNCGEVSSTCDMFALQSTPMSWNCLKTFASCCSAPSVSISNRSMFSIKRSIMAFVSRIWCAFWARLSWSSLSRESHSLFTKSLKALNK